MKKFLICAAVMMFLSGALYADKMFKEGNRLYLTKDYEEALNKYSDFISDNPDYYEGYFNAGNSLYKMEKFDKAAEMYEKTLEKNPEFEDAKINKELALEQLREQQEQQGEQNQQGEQEQQGEQNQQGEQEQQGEQNQQGEQEQQGEQGQQGEEQSAQERFGMSEDEAQALMNMMQNNEKRYKQYHGEQRRDPRGMDIFEMMERRMRQMDPFYEPQQGRSSDEKDW